MYWLKKDSETDVMSCPSITDKKIFTLGVTSFIVEYFPNVMLNYKYWNHAHNLKCSGNLRISLRNIVITEIARPVLTLP